MGLYATAYGKPAEVYNHAGFSSKFNYDDLKRQYSGCSCVHAKADHGMLKNDEIVFYNEAQVTINYLCEFAA